MTSAYYARGRKPAAPLTVALGARASVPGDLVDEGRDFLRVLTVDEVGGHLALAAGAALLDRVERQGLRRVELVEVRADLADSVRGGERVARRAPFGEDLAPALVRGGQLHAAGR